MQVVPEGTLAGLVGAREAHAQIDDARPQAVDGAGHTVELLPAGRHLKVKVGAG